MSRREFYEEQKLKKIVYTFCIILILSIVIFLTIFVMYNKKLKQESSERLLSLENMSNIVSNDELEETSFSEDASIATATNKMESTNTTNTNQVTKNTSAINRKRNTVNTIPVQAVVENTILDEQNTTVISEVAEQKELEFIAPVSGEIMKDFAIDTLIYSNTLEEWTTHSGIDIKADKTTIVVAAESGTIESIKNDPRYGLTITITHGNGFKTIYSNLLTTEFITENEVVKKGQTIATIGDTSSFEIADDAHLHFEMYKDGNVVNPTIYLK